MPSLSFTEMDKAVEESSFGLELKNYSNEIAAKHDIMKKDEIERLTLNEYLTLMIELTNGFPSQFAALYEFLNKNAKITFGNFQVNPCKTLLECRNTLLEDAKRRVEKYLLWQYETKQNEVPPLYEFVGCKNVNIDTKFLLSNGKRISLKDFFRFGMIKYKVSDCSITFPPIFLCCITNPVWFDDIMKKINSNNNNNENDTGCSEPSEPSEKRRKSNSGRIIKSECGSNSSVWDWVSTLFMIPESDNELNGKMFEKRLVARFCLKSREFKQVSKKIDDILYTGLGQSLSEFLGVEKEECGSDDLFKTCENDWFFARIERVNNDNDAFCTKVFEKDVLVHAEQANYPVIDFYFNGYCVDEEKWYLLAFQSKNSIKLANKEYTDADCDKFWESFKSVCKEKNLIIILASVGDNPAARLWKAKMASNVVFMGKLQMQRFFGSQYQLLLNLV